MLTVEYDGRIDEQTMKCRIWFAPREGFALKIVVPVRATYDEVHMIEAPPLPWDVKLRAIAAARAFTGEFTELDVGPDLGGG
jgi:hypothetical protein